MIKTHEDKKMSFEKESKEMFSKFGSYSDDSIMWRNTVNSILSLHRKHAKEWALGCVPKLPERFPNHNNTAVYIPTWQEKRAFNLCREQMIKNINEGE